MRSTQENETLRRRTACERNWPRGTESTAAQCVARDGHKGLDTRSICLTHAKHKGHEPSQVVDNWSRPPTASGRTGSWGKRLNRVQAGVWLVWRTWGVPRCQHGSEHVPCVVLPANHAHVWGAVQAHGKMSARDQAYAVRWDSVHCVCVCQAYAVRWDSVHCVCVYFFCFVFPPKRHITRRGAGSRVGRAVGFEAGSHPCADLRRTSS